MRALPEPSELWGRWALDPEAVYLNHGSFGACPRAVLEAQRGYRDRMEAEAVRFFVEELEGLIDASRAALAAFVKCRAEDLVFVPNATTGVATVLANLEAVLKPGDELLVNDHEYPSCLNNARRTAARTGAQVVIVPAPFPVRAPDEVYAAVMAAVSGRTRVALLSHVTSPTAIRLPIERLVPELESRGVATIVDGAHAPGQVPDLDLQRLGASYYTANCHKWICSPKGSALLWIREDRQRGFRPLVLSNHAEKPKAGRKHLQTEFDYVGTSDVTAWMAVGDAIRHVGGLVPGGWAEVMRRNHEMMLRGRDTVCRALGVRAPAPDTMLGSMSTIVLPPHPPELGARLRARPTRYHDALQDALLERHRIQVPVWGIPGAQGGPRFVRISAQLYNSAGQYEYLAGALAEELDRERRG